MINGTVKVQKSIYNITDNLAKAGVDPGYSAVQGYTINNTNTGSLFMARWKGTDDDVLVAYIDNLNKPPKVSDNRGLGHANDCAFYNNGYFVAMGSKNFKTTKIKCLNKSLEHIATYSYVPMPGETPFDKISCIAYLKDGYFVVGTALKYSVCKIDATEKTFVEKSRFDLSDGSCLSRKNKERRGQGIYCIEDKIYKIFSYEEQEIIKQNDLAVFRMPGSYPYYKGTASLIGCYSCDRPSKTFFELESLASPDRGYTFYIAANVKEAGATGQKDSIYSATLSDA